MNIKMNSEVKVKLLNIVSQNFNMSQGQILKQSLSLWNGN